MHIVAVLLVVLEYREPGPGRRRPGPASQIDGWIKKETGRDNSVMTIRFISVIAVVCYRPAYPCARPCCDYHDAWRNKNPRNNVCRDAVAPVPHTMRPIPSFFYPAVLLPPPRASLLACCPCPCCCGVFFFLWRNRPALDRLLSADAGSGSKPASMALKRRRWLGMLCAWVCPSRQLDGNRIDVRRMKERKGEEGVGNARRRRPGRTS